MTKPLIIIPTYNERENLKDIVNATLKAVEQADILIIDDNSPDGTGEIAENLCEKDSRVHVLHRKQREGLGRAYISGFVWALKKNYDPICTMDADFSHNPKDLPRLIDSLEPGIDVVVGSRYVEGGEVEGWSLFRALLSKGSNFIAKTMLNLKQRDVTAGFKCYRRSFLESLDLDEVIAPGYAFQIEMLARAKFGGFTIREIPVTFRDRTKGESKVSSFELSSSAGSLFRLTLERNIVRQFTKFFVVGVINFAVDIGFTNAFVIFLHWPETISGWIATALAVINSFFLNRAWTFRGQPGNFWQQLGRFLVVNGSGALINALCYGILVSQFHIWYNWAKLLAIVGSFAWNFLGTRYFVFRSRPGK